ncbi:MAG: DNA mismatch repair protein MutS, partial [Geminicoccaceae bacterium]|nr:DNA mismatch repair protein MutS [Geminicoccaceae bacterium]
MTEAESPAGEPVSPMIAQYRELKAAHPHTLLFFRMGDFYELFFEDAVEAAPLLDVALTRRGRHQGRDIPMCGVPAHNAEPYIERLIRRGRKVAICEQLEDPAEAKKRGGRPLLRRDVVRIVTPGTLTEDGLLEARRHNYLAAVARGREGWGAAWVDISTGDFRTQLVEASGLAALLARLEPGELLVAERLAADPAIAAIALELRERLTRHRDAAFEPRTAARRLEAFFAIADLAALGSFSPAELAAAGALLDYLELTQKGALPRLARPQRVAPRSVLELDPATRRNLELTRSLSGEVEGGLLHTIDRTKTAAGARLLAERLAAPLLDPAAIRARLDRVEAFLEDEGLREEVRAELARCPDLERSLARLALGRGGPRDLLAVAKTLAAAERIAARLAEAGPPLALLVAELPDFAALRERLERTLVEEPPLLARDGGLVRPGADPELDRERSLRDAAHRHLAALEARYREETGIGSLKIRHNQVLGWFVEVPQSRVGELPERFALRQSMAGAGRFATSELAELAQNIAAAAERALALELSIFEELRRAVLEAAEPLGRWASTLAEIVVAAELATLARERRWTRPTVDEEPRIRIVAGRHPVVEAALAARHEPFVANDLELGPEDRLWLVTGPNMAGKSTFLRQCALLVLLAQTGSFVPAESAAIGVVDRIFSRVGAADDLARGRSTFMVEMVETATILNQAGPRSFVILDEIGRGTATWDGLSLAWAVLEHLHDVNRCLGLFATHFHELTALAARLPALSTHTVKVKEWRGEVVFLHEVARGTADRSYGIHVAKLAGLPAAVIRRAEEVLRRLEEGEPRSAPARLAEDLPLFAAAA